MKICSHSAPVRIDVQRSIIDDQALVKDVEELIRQNLGAEKAFEIVMFEWGQRFARAASPMLRERVGDLKDVEIRVLTLLLDLPDHDPVDLPKGANAILVTHDLTPSLTVQLDREAISGIATDAGTRTSHVAILARSLGLPAVVGLRDATSRLHAGDQVVLDGSSGMLIPNPSDILIEAYTDRALREAADEVELQHLVGAEPVTLDGVRIILRANVDLPEDAEFAAHSGAEGVGLMRTEGKNTLPASESTSSPSVNIYDRPLITCRFNAGSSRASSSSGRTRARPWASVTSRPAH